MSPFPEPPPGSVTNCELCTVVPSLMTLTKINAGTDLKVIECKGKGKGLFTNKAFKEGEYIIKQERGIIVKGDERVSEQALRYRLSTEEIKILDSLESHNTNSLVTVLDTNAFQLASDDEEHQKWCVFPKVSRINHSCSPNCVALISPDGLADIKVISHIPRNSEITISYNRLSHGLSPCYRVRNLLNTKKFMCNCELCFKKRIADPEKQMKVIDYCLENLNESDCDKTVEELIGTVHAAAKVLKGGYKHWVVAFSLRTLMLNATAAISHFEYQNKEWNLMVAILIKYFTKWATYQIEHNDEYGILPDVLPQWLVTLLYDSIANLLQTDISSDESLPQTLFDALSLIYKPHCLYYGSSHTDSRFIASTMSEMKSKIPVENNERKYFDQGSNMLAYTILNPESVLLQDYIQNEEPLANKIVAPTSVYTKEFLALGLDESSFSAVDRHAARLHKMFTSV